MERLTRQKLEQAGRLVSEAGADAWLVFVRETAEGGDPVLPLILDGGLTWQSALLVTADGRRIAVVGNYDAPPLEASGDWHEVVPYVQGIRQPLLETLERVVAAETSATETFATETSAMETSATETSATDAPATDASGAGPSRRPSVPRRPRIAVDFSLGDDKADGLTHGMYLVLQDILKGTRFEGALVSAEEIVLPLRSRKTPVEIDRMRGAIEATEALFAEVGRTVRVGMTEREVFDLLQRRIEEENLGFSWDRSGDPIVNSGPDSMIGHGKPSETIRIAPGHIFHIDMGVLRDGYASDIQRCWFVPETERRLVPEVERRFVPAMERRPADRDAPDPIPEDVRRAFRAVHDAISAGASVLRPGVEGWTVDAAARASIQASGYPEYLHALGHQVGRMAHDGGGGLYPRWERYGQMPYRKIEADQVYTLELGVEIEGRGYLGLEEMVRVPPGGVEWLTRRQDALWLLGGRETD